MSRKQTPSSRPAPVRPYSTGYNSSGTPVPSAPSTGMSWAGRVAQNNPNVNRPLVLIRGNWFCSIPKEERSFIENTSALVAKEYNCDYIAIRSAIHDTTTVKDPRTGVKSFVPHPWHYTVEMQHRETKRWMGVHVYTDTREVMVGNGRRKRVTHGIKKSGAPELIIEGIDENPKVWQDVKPGKRGNPQDSRTGFNFKF